MSTKNEQILLYIESLPVGNKISVRSIAKAMKVSEGTAYRAIKDAETEGIVSTIERVGTVRIEKQQKKNIERLTFAEVVNIVDGTVLGGKAGLHKTLHKFVIGAMEINEMIRYIDRDSLLIVGNRVKVHSLSLEQGAAVLISGGFDTTDEVRSLADRLELPLISSSYDTFTIASLINRAIYDRLIKKEILLIEDVLKSEVPIFMHTDERVSDWHAKVEQSGHTRYPVIDEQERVVGMVTAKDTSGQSDEMQIERVMTKNPLTVTLKSSVASAAHTMVWEGIELLPVVNNRRLHGVISREDIIKALQYNQKQPQMGDTIHDLILSGFKEERIGEKSLILTGEMTPQMAGTLGGVSPGVVMTLVAEAGAVAIRKFRNANMVVENVSVYFLKPIQIDTVLTIQATVLDVGRRFGKVDVELYVNQELVGKALFTGGVLQK